MDRIEEIKNGSFTAGDVIWLVSEVERLRAERNSAINEASRLHRRLGSVYDSLSKELHRAALNSDDLYTLLDAIIHQRRGAMTELNEIHDILAEGPRLPEGPDARRGPQLPVPRRLRHGRPHSSFAGC